MAQHEPNASELHELTYKNTKPYCPRPLQGKVVKVYDGDTVWVACVIDGNATRVCVRMHGYDTAEMRTHDAAEKAAAIGARNALQDLVMDKVVQLSIQGQDKYGRLIAILTVDGTNVNDVIQSSWGVPYEGGTKTHPDWSQFPKA